MKSESREQWLIFQNFGCLWNTLFVKFLHVYVSFLVQTLVEFHSFHISESNETCFRS